MRWLPLHLLLLSLICSFSSKGQESFLIECAAIADTLRYDGEYESSIALYSEVLESVNFSEHVDFWVKYELRKGISYSSLGNDNDALHCYKNVMDSLRAVGDTLHSFYAHAVNNTANLMRPQGLKSNFSTWNSRARTLYDLVGNQRMYLNATVNRGLFYKEIGNYPKAMELFAQAGDGFEQLDDHNGVAQINNAMGMVQELLGDYRAAKNSYRLSLFHAEISNSKSIYANTLSNLGGICRLVNELDSSQYYLERAVRIKEEIDSPNLGRSLHNLALSQKDDGRIAPARENFKKAIEFKKARGSYPEVAMSMLELIELDLKEGKLTGIEDRLKLCSLYLEETSAPNRRHLLRVYKEYFSITGDFNSLIQTMDEISEIDNELNRQEYLKEVAMFQESFRAGQSERTIGQLNDSINKTGEALVDVHEKLENAKTVNWVLVSMFIMIGLILFVVFQMFRQKSEIEALKSKYEGAEEEKRRISMELHDSSGSTLRSIQSRLERVEERMSDEHIKQQISSVNKDIKKISNDISTISHSLFHPMMEGIRFSEIYRRMIRRWSTDSGHPVVEDLLDLEILDGFKDNSKSHIFRCTQEALTNVHRHANAEKVEVSLRNEEGMMTIIIKDDGSGMSFEDTRGIGLDNIDLRTRLMNGRFRTFSDENGTTVRLMIPIESNVA